MIIFLSLLSTRTRTRVSLSLEEEAAAAALVAHSVLKLTYFFPLTFKQRIGNENPLPPFLHGVAAATAGRSSGWLAGRPAHRSALIVFFQSTTTSLLSKSKCESKKTSDDDNKVFWEEKMKIVCIPIFFISFRFIFTFFWGDCKYEENDFFYFQIF